MNFDMLMLDAIYLVFFRIFKENPRVQWEREAHTAISMALPLLIWVECFVHITRKYHGIAFLGQLLPNKILYVAVVFVPIWLLVFLMTRQLNKLCSPKKRMGKVDSTLPKLVQYLLATAYVAVPLVWAITLLVRG